MYQISNRDDFRSHPPQNVHHNAVPQYLLMKMSRPRGLRRPITLKASNASPPPRTVGSQKPNGKMLTEKGGTPSHPLTDFSVTGGFEGFPKCKVNPSRAEDMKFG